MPIKISVVVPTYNRPNLLVNCLKSLQNQTLDKDLYEIIVVSDGPDSKTERAMQSWINKDTIQVRFIQNPEKQGPASTRNLGWLSATAALIAFTDDDCLPDRNWLNSILEHYQGEEFLAFTGKTIVPLPENPSDFALNLSHLGEADFITANCACTKTALLKVGGFDERFRMAWREDSDLEFKFLNNQIPIRKIKNAIVVHPIREVRWGVSAYEQKKGIYDALLFKKYPKLYREKIQRHPLWFYYLTLALVIALFAAIYQQSSAWIFFGFAYLACLLYFTLKRLKKTSTAGKHVLEMLSTSLVIPFLSIYYRIYGAIKFRTFFF